MSAIENDGIDVDVMSIGTSPILRPGQSQGHVRNWPGEIGPRKWARMVPAMLSDNSPGTTIQIVEEKFKMGDAGDFETIMVVKNVGQSNAVYEILVLSGSL